MIDLFGIDPVQESINLLIAKAKCLREEGVSGRSWNRRRLITKITYLATHSLCCMSLAPRSPLLDGGRLRHNNISATEFNALFKNLRHELKVLLGPFSKFDTKICKQQINNLQVLDGARQSSLH